MTTINASTMHCEEPRTSNSTESSTHSRKMFHSIFECTTMPIFYFSVKLILHNLLKEIFK